LEPTWFHSTHMTRSLKNTYRGRFAPSPTGPLHFGSLVTAVGSYLQARSQQGEWLVRMEDLDPPREIPGAADEILRALEAYHLFWDGPVLYQSQRQEAYDDTLTRLATEQHSFPCGCSRKSIADATPADKKTQTAGHTPYPGTCREGLPPGTTARAIRVRVPQKAIRFHDGLQGLIETQLASTVGDFVVHRADGLTAYHLAVVVDDAFQGITEIVRGSDLLESTPPQLHLQDLLGFKQPNYIHLPIVTNSQGQKLSKQTFAAAIDQKDPGPTLAKALTFLGHAPEPSLAKADPARLLEWATGNWDINKIPKCAAICG